MRQSALANLVGTEAPVAARRRREQREKVRQPPAVVNPVRLPVVAALGEFRDRSLRAFKESLSEERI